MTAKSSTWSATVRTLRMNGMRPTHTHSDANDCFMCGSQGKRSLTQMNTVNFWTLTLHMRFFPAMYLYYDKLSINGY